MIRWALILITLTVPQRRVDSVEIMHIYDSPDDCQERTSHVHPMYFKWGKPQRWGIPGIPDDSKRGEVTCAEIDGNKPPQPQVDAFAAHRK